jgi:glycosyltransferase involved in cell wall biosynthesis
MKRFFYLPYLSLLKSTDLRQKTILTCSDWTAKRMMEHISRQMNYQVLYPPVNTSFFRISDEPREDLVVSFSRISPEKHMDDLPEVASLLGDRISFVIAGNLQSMAALHSIREAIRKYKVKDRVQVLPNISQDQLRYYYGKAKVYLHMCKTEAFGMTIAEAMSSGCIPVAPDSAGPKEFVPKRFRYSSVAEATEQVKEAISNWTPQRAIEMREIAKDFSEVKFNENLSHILAKYVEDHL